MTINYVPPVVKEVEPARVEFSLSLEEAAKVLALAGWVANTEGFAFYGDLKATLADNGVSLKSVKFVTGDPLQCALTFKDM